MVTSIANAHHGLPVMISTTAQMASTLERIAVAIGFTWTPKCE